MAQRLTVHPAYDFAPIWSPDGKKIAFTSDRHGNDDVFVLHLDTGAVQRLTYFSARDRAWGWTPDSRAVLFESRRESEPYGADFSAYVAPLDGGTPYRLHKASGSPFALSPDGRRLAFVRRDSAWWRKGYKGSAQGDLWLLERATNRYVRLTDTDTPDTFPMWGADGRTLYFVSERDGAANLYALDTQTRRIRPLTRFKDDGIRFPHISANGAVITFEQGLDIYRLDTATGAIQSIPLQVPAQDARAAEQVRRTFSANVEDYALAPDGKEFVFAVRGELFAARFPDGGPSRNLTETVEPEGDPQLAPDGKTLYFAAERDGATQIYRLTSGDADEPRLRRARTHKVEPLTSAPQGASKPRLSPDGKLLAYQRGLGELVVRHLETQQERTLTESWNLGTIVWSPDSRWIAFDRYDENYNADVFVVRVPEFATPTPDAEPKQEKQEPSGAGDAVDDAPVVYNISRHPRNDFAPSWSTDGRALVFLSERETDVLNICHVWLRREDYERTRADREEEEDDKHDAPKKADEKKEPLRVDIDLDDIHLRVLTVPLPGGIYGQVAGLDKKRLLVSSFPIEGTLDEGDWTDTGEEEGKGTLILYDFSRAKSEELIHGITRFAVSLDGKTLVYQTGSRLRVLPAGQKPDEKHEHDPPSRESGWIDLSRVRCAVVPSEEWRQMYREAWRLQREFFWTPDMSGVDWQKVYDRYYPLLERVATRAEFSDLMWEMQGELGTSHCYEFGGDYRQPPQYTLGFLGAEFEWDEKAQGYRITHIHTGDPWLENADSPLNEPGVLAQVGEVLIAINGQRLSRTRPPGELLLNQAGMPVQLTLRAPDGTTRTVVTKTLTSEARLLYREWVNRNRAYVHAKTDGQVGYIHIPDMGSWGFSEFHRGFLPELVRPGLIVDVRGNGGGFISALLLEKLARKRLGYDVPRWGKPMPYPHDSPMGPIVAITDERAGSDGDMFSHAFKLMKIGVLIGKRTWGGVIGIWPKSVFVDQGLTTQPEYAFWFYDVGWRVENYGTDPDIEVDYAPHDYAQGRDPQLDRAIEEILKQMEANPPRLPDFEPRPKLPLPTLPKR